MVKGNNNWDEKVDVVVVGDGCAGAVAAIAAREEGADVLVIEKQPKDSHCPSTAMTGGILLLPRDKAALGYLESLYKIPAGACWGAKDVLREYIKYGLTVKNWLEERGGKIRPELGLGEHRELAGHDAFVRYHYAGMGFRLQHFLNSNLEAKKVPVNYGIRAKRLITNHNGRVVGVEVEKDSGKGKKFARIGASKGVILATGGFEYNETMKLNYLPVHPTYFTGHPSATGDGIKMCLAIGADLWHMNCLSARLVAKFPDFPIAFDISTDSTHVRGIPAKIAMDKRPGYIIVGRDGKRFTNEDFKRHSVYYELAGFDTHRLVYPRVPCFWIMDRRRIEIDYLVRVSSGAAGPHGPYKWSRDNSAELEKGWIMSAGSIRELANKLGLPSKNLEETVNAYNHYCIKGKDPDFGRTAESLISLDMPPFFAVKLWPGGPNTQGGPKRNAKCQVLNTDGEPIPGLYSAGEMGSMFGMLYPGAGSNLTECLAMGRVAGEAAAHTCLK